MKIKDLLSRSFKKRRLIDYILYIAVLIGGVVIDQLTKVLAVAFVKPVPTIPLIEGVIHLTYVENTGAAFGMLKDAPWVFNTFSTIAIVAMLLYLFLGHANGRLYEISIAMIISGGIGNMIDRLALGYVVDFIDFRLINFAVFNGADSLVCVGAGLLILALILEIVNESRENKKKAEEEERQASVNAHREDSEDAE
ncbi:MAG: signal peptidase II [Clostridia bacterium]|nr:signal peptidase II [Clostridia bacterium]